MVRPIRVLVAVVLLPSLLACSGLVDPKNFEGATPPSPAYVGRWEGTGMVVEIDADGQVAISRHDGNSNVDVAAPARAWTDDAVEIGIGPFTTRYRIDERPYERDGAWRMVVEGVPLERVSTTVGTDSDPPSTPAPPGHPFLTEPR